MADTPVGHDNYGLTSAFPGHDKVGWGA
jgi:hypothetical protein